MQDEAGEMQGRCGGDAGSSGSSDLSGLDGELGYVEGEVFRIGRMQQDGFLHVYSDLFRSLVSQTLRLEEELV